MDVFCLKTPWWPRTLYCAMSLRIKMSKWAWASIWRVRRSIPWCLQKARRYKMNILYVTGEAAPFCKTGGLADVSGSLPVALAARGQHVAVILPLYNSISTQWREKMTFRRYIYVDLAW